MTAILEIPCPSHKGRHLARQGLAWLLTLLSFGFPIANAAEPELISVIKIGGEGKHNAFTDLTRWRDHWFCTFRESVAHVGGEGKIRVLESADGTKWTSAALIAESGIDLRDPKFSITPDDRLMIVAGGSRYEGKTLLGARPRVFFSTDSHLWTNPKEVLEEGSWLWRVTWHAGKAYGISYDVGTNPATRSVPRGLRLVESMDGIHYNEVCRLDVPDSPNESTIRFTADGQMIALVRREAGDKHAWIGQSRPPYRDWTWNDTGMFLGGPNFIELPDHTWWAAGRMIDGPPKTAIARMTMNHLTPALTLPSGGDTSYPGLVWHDGLLWMSYYASHEGSTAIYLARIKLPSTDFKP